MARPSVIAVLQERGIRGLLMAIVRRLRGGSQSHAHHHIHIDDVSRNVRGVDVVGFFTAEHGVGEAARTLVSALRTTDIEISTINYTDTESRTEHLFVTDDVSRHHTLLMSINADQLVVARDRLGDHFFDNRYVIGQWFWELETAPAWYEPAWPIVNELWAPTRFIEEMLKKHAPSNVVIRHVPLPIVPPRIDDSLTRPRWNLDGRYMFLFVFDLMSIMKRKNPLGLISAYSKAFSETDGAQLVIKTMNGDKRSDDLALLLNAAASRSDITIINEVFTSTETSTLISLADCYVSLHRSEGLGLTLSEAMSLGKPVIATNYSGNTDFMADSNSFLIPWSRVSVGEGAGGYDPTATWAEPNEDAAVEAMRFVFKNQQEARIRGARAREDVLGGHSQVTAGAIMKSRLEEIWRSRRGQ
jgi:glycosyltransferase involved in cell wall biosynthesis